MYISGSGLTRGQLLRARERAARRARRTDLATSDRQAKTQKPSSPTQTRPSRVNPNWPYIHTYILLLYRHLSIVIKQGTCSEICTSSPVCILPSRATGVPAESKRTGQAHGDHSNGVGAASCASAVVGSPPPPAGAPAGAPGEGVATAMTLGKRSKNCCCCSVWVLRLLASDISSSMGPWNPGGGTSSATTAG